MYSKREWLSAIGSGIVSSALIIAFLIAVLIFVRNADPALLGLAVGA